MASSNEYEIKDQSYGKDFIRLIEVEKDGKLLLLAKCI
jgi:hypothetical protein